jgi:microcystin-dependent protein
MVQFSKSNLGDIDQETLPIGFIFPVLNSNTPPEGTLVLDGSSLDKTTYADLYSGFDLSLGDQFGNADAGSFYLPDFRGRTVRGRDQGIARDPDRATRTADQSGAPTGDNVGSCQNDDFKAHLHAYMRVQTPNSEDGTKSQPYGPSNERWVSTGAFGGSTETRMKNINVLWVIKY